MGNSKDHSLDTYALTLIRVKAGQLIGRHGFTSSDREDIEQELTLHLLKRIGRFDPARGGKNTFVSRVVDRKVASIIRRRYTMKQECERAMRSINGSDDRAVGGGFTEPAVDDREQRDLRIDLQEALDLLPSDLRALVKQLGAGTVGQAARESGQSREAIRRQIRELRRHFRKHGLRDYLPAHQSAGRSRK